MAKIQRELFGDFDDIIADIHDAVVGGSVTGEMIESSQFKGSEARCSVMVFERYSAMYQSRVTLSVTLFQTEGRIFISAAATGGSSARFVKINTIPEDSMLETVRYCMRSFSPRPEISRWMSAAASAARAAFSDPAYFQKTRQKIIATRERTARQLGELGFTVLPSQANFIFVTHPNVPGAHLFRSLRERGVLVRYFQKPRIDQFLRITIGTEAEMDILVAALREILEAEA